MNGTTRRCATFGMIAAMGWQAIPMAGAAPAPCSPLMYAEIKRWQPKDLIAAYCADKAEAERLLPKSTPGSALRSVVEANQVLLDACERQMDMFERALIEQLGRPMPPCSRRR